MNRWAVGGIAAITLALASCGSPTQTASSSARVGSSPLSSSTPTPSPTATAQPTGPLAACLRTSSGGTPAPWGFAMTKGSEVEVVGTSGAVLDTAPLGNGYTLTEPVTVGVGQAGVYFYDESTGGLSVLGKNGAAQNLAQVSPPGGWSAGDNAISLAESPNRECWAFSLVTYNASQVATSQIYVGGTGITTTLVDTVTRANTVNGAAAGWLPAPALGCFRPAPGGPAHRRRRWWGAVYRRRLLVGHRGAPGSSDRHAVRAPLQQRAVRR